MITDKALVFSNKKYSSFGAMARNLKGTSVMEEKEEFWYNGIKEISYLSNGEDLTVKKLDFRKNLVSLNVNLDDIDAINVIVSEMSKEGQFTKKEEKASMLNVAKASLIRTAVAGGFTAVFYLAETDQANANEVDDSRKGFLKEILERVLDTIGPIGVLIIGGGLTLLFLWQLIQKLKNPPSLIKWASIKN